VTLKRELLKDVEEVTSHRTRISFEAGFTAAAAQLHYFSGNFEAGEFRVAASIAPVPTGEESHEDTSR
jgi:ornithine carbamoyltransferase